MINLGILGLSCTWDSLSRCLWRTALCFASASCLLNPASPYFCWYLINYVCWYLINYFCWYFLQWKSTCVDICPCEKSTFVDICPCEKLLLLIFALVKKDFCWYLLRWKKVQSIVLFLLLSISIKVLSSENKGISFDEKYNEPLSTNLHNKHRVFVNILHRQNVWIVINFNWYWDHTNLWITESWFLNQKSLNQMCEC